MVKRKSELPVTVRKEMAGGKKQVLSTALLAPEEFGGSGRVFSRLLLAPGCSIGLHQHMEEWEAFYIEQGSGIYYDGDQAVPVQAGDVAIVADGGFHGIENNQPEGDLAVIALVLYTKQK